MSVVAVVKGERGLESVFRAIELIPFQEGYVQPQQPVVIGNQKYTVKQWLEALGIFAEYNDDDGLTIKVEKLN